MVYERRASTRESLTQFQKQEKQDKIAWIRYSRDYSSLLDDVVPTKNVQETVVLSCTNSKKSGQKAPEDDLTATKLRPSLATKQVSKDNVVSVPDAKKVSAQPVGSKNQAGLTRMIKNPRSEKVRYSRDYSFLLSDEKPDSGVKGVPQVPQDKRVSAPVVRKVSTQPIGSKNEVDWTKTAKKPILGSISDARKVSTQPVGSKREVDWTKTAKKPILESISDARKVSTQPIGSKKEVYSMKTSKKPILESISDARKVSCQPVGSKKEVYSTKTVKKPILETMRSRDYSFLTDKREHKKEGAPMIPKGFIKKEGLTKTPVKNVSSSTTRREGSENHGMKKTKCEQRSRDPVKGKLQEMKSKTLKRKASVFEDKEEDPITMIRKLFNYDPTGYGDDYNCDNMEASFADIEKEERRSAKLARIEDKIEQEKLDAEAERRRRLRRK